MNTKIFKNFTRNRKLEHSTFDMGFKNVGTANFGALQVKGVLPVMPGDKWSIGLDSLTKVDPMSAPAFTRIMQNTYAFYVPNQCVWSYWNDYISNGSAFLDTYGNNATNQDLLDSWRPPITSVMDLQQITKIADGWSIPVWSVDLVGIQAINTLLQQAMSAALQTSRNLYVISTSDAYANRPYKMSLYFWHIIETICHKQYNYLPSALFSFAYYAPVFEFEFEDISGVSDRKKLVSFELKSLTVGGSFETWSNFCNLVLGLETISNDTKHIYPNFGLNPTEYDSASLNCLNLDFVHFCDPAALPDAKTDPPFFLRRNSVKSIRETPVNSYLYENYLPEAFDLSSPDYPIRYVSSKRGMYGKTFQSDERAGVSVRYTLYDTFQADFNFWSNGNNLPYVFRFFYEDWNSCLALLDNNIQGTGSVASNPGAEFPSLFVAKSNMTNAEYSPFSYPTIDPNDGSNDMFCYGEAQQYITTRFRFPYFSYQNAQLIDFNFYNTPYGIWYDPESFSCGWSSFGFLVYLCISARQNMERMNLPVDSFTPKRFSDYNQEFIESIPWFGVAKIHGDYFRNKAVSTAELDYCKCNSVAFNDSVRSRYYGNAFGQYQNVPQWISDLCEKENSWVIPFETAPKSGVGANLHLASLGQGESLIERATQNFHYYDITSSQNLFSLLTGYSLKFSVLSKMLERSEWRVTGFADQVYVVNLFLEHIYLPSYYNGLLHQRFQNFNQDYFSSSLFDAMSGANQVNVPTTITELRSAERKQTFWERLAMNRSFQSFSEKFFGVKPYHDDVDKPLMLGSMHTRLEIGEVVQTSQTSASSSQGTRSGLGAGRGNSGLVSRVFSEYGYIILLQSHTVEVQYFQGLEKHWSPKESFLDYPFFDFVSIGNQPIFERELNYGIMPEVTERRPVPSLTLESNYVAGYPHTQSNGYNNPNFIRELSRQNFTIIPDGSAKVRYNQTATPSVVDGHTEIFGYVSRFSEWKFKFDELHGEFRNELDFWHTFRRFFVRPLLSHEFVNWEFMVDDNELNRLFNVLENDISDKFKVFLRFNCKVRRALPYICQPSM